MISAVATVKQKLTAGGVSIGSWLTLGSPAAAEIMAHAGFDFLTIDGEHAGTSLDAVQEMLRAMKGTEVIPILRVPSNARADIKVALDLGVKGIIVPMVNSREEAEGAVRACKYPPAGVRGIDPGRASLFGRDLWKYLATANDETLVFIIAEHHEALTHIEEVASVPGLDAVFFGYYDYAASIGLHETLDHPTVLAAQDAVLQAAKRASVATAYTARSPSHAKELIKCGFQVVTIGGDAPFVIGGKQSVVDAMRA